MNAEERTPEQPQQPPEHADEHEDASPPAARLVVETAPSEREAELERLLQEERHKRARTEEEKRQREIRIAELEDELHRLRRLLDTPRQPQPQRPLGPGWWPYPEDQETEGTEET